MKDKLEAILFAAGRFIDEDQIATLLQEDVRRVRKGLQELKKYYDGLTESSLQIVQEEKSWKLHVKDTYLDLVSKLVSDKEIAKTVLETLAIIAWKNPAMQAELIKIRGPAAYEHVAELMQREFITKEPLGRTFQLRVTQKFFDYFDVEGREGIRSLFKSVEEKAAAQQAEVDKEKADYQTQLEAAKASAEPGNEDAAEAVKGENSTITSQAPSAQTPTDLFSELKQEVAEFGKDVQSMKEKQVTHTEEHKKASKHHK